MTGAAKIGTLHTADSSTMKRQLPLRPCSGQEKRPKETYQIRTKRVRSGSDIFRENDRQINRHTHEVRDTLVQPILTRLQVRCPDVLKNARFRDRQHSWNIIPKRSKNPNAPPFDHRCQWWMEDREGDARHIALRLRRKPFETRRCCDGTEQVLQKVLSPPEEAHPSTALTWAANQGKGGTSSTAEPLCT